MAVGLTLNIYNPAGLKIARAPGSLPDANPFTFDAKLGGQALDITQVGKNYLPTPLPMEPVITIGHWFKTLAITLYLRRFTVNIPSLNRHGVVVTGMIILQART